MKDAWFILNPRSGGGEAGKRMEEIRKTAISFGWRGKMVEATEDKRVGQIAMEAAEKGVRQIIICGGDGAIREALETVVKKRLLLGIVPLGTGNVLAKNLNISLNIPSAVETALTGKKVTVDIGKANGNYFSVVTGMGIDVDMMRETNKRMKNRWGILAYVLTGIKLLSKRSKKFRIVLDGNKTFRFRAKSIMVANMGKTVGGIQMVPGADPFSGDLSIGVVRGRNLLAWIDLLLNIWRGDINKSPYYGLFKIKKADIIPLGKPRRYECDGDEFPPTDKLEVVVIPGALRVIIPDEMTGDRLVSKRDRVMESLQLKNKYGLGIVTSNNAETVSNILKINGKEKF